MSNLPVDPTCDCHPIIPDAPPSQDLVTYTPTATSTALPLRVEDLDPPYSAYPSIALDATPYPENGIYGMGIRHVRPYAHWVFERWHTWSLNDFYAVYVNDLLNTLAADVTLDDRSRYDLFVPEERVPEGEVPIYGRVLRAGSFQESTSELQTILIKTTRPGGIDRDPGSEWHTGLVMTVEDLPEGSVIDHIIAQGGVWCLIERYQHIRQNDRIELSWDGVIVTHIVSPAEAAGTGPIRVFVSEAIIHQGGHLGTLNLRFRVQDVVENFSGEKYQYSKPYFVVSELDPNLLEAPVFLVDDVESQQIDFDTQSEARFTLSCFTGRMIPAPNPPYRVIVTLRATLVDGAIQVFTLPAVNATNLFITEVAVSSEIIEQIVGGSFRASFLMQTAAGVFIGQSGSVTVTVVGTPVTMPAVTITPIELGLIDPGNDIEVSIPFYEPYNTDWLETLFIEHRVSGGGGETYLESQLAGPQGGTRHVSKEDLQRFNGLGIIYFYYVVTDGINTRKSAEIGAQVGERIANMPAPLLEGALGNNVDPAHVSGPTVLLTLPYTGTVSGDLIHWNSIGSALGGSASGNITVNAATEGQPLVFPVTRNILDFNLNGSLRITYSLERAGPPRQVLRSEPLNLTVGQGVQLDRPIIIEAQQFPDRLDPLAALSGATVVVKFRPMHATDHIYVEWLSADGIGSVTLQVQGNPVTNEVSVTVPRGVIAQGIRQDGNRISVQYHFFRSSLPYESEVLNLELLPLTGLPTPTIDGIGDSMVLPLSQLTDATRTRISVWSFIAPNQRMWMTYEGTFADDTPFIENTYTANLVTEDGVTNGIYPPTPVDKLRRLKDGSQLTIRFWVTLSESLDKNSAVLFGVREHIVQAIPATLPAPAFANQVTPNLSIYPLDYEHTASVTVAYSGMTSSHRIELQWFFPNSSMASIPIKNGLDGGRVDFAISQKILADSLGKTITLRYIATINGSPVDSFLQTLTVQTLRTSDLPQALINYLPNYETLDLRHFIGNALASVAKWPLSVQGQRVWITCSGLGVPTLTVVNGDAITSSEAANGLVNKTVLRSWLNQVVPSNYHVLVYVKVSFDGGTNESNAILFPATSYRLAGQIPQFTIPSTTMVLNGVSVRINWPRTGLESINNTATRAASGGVPPYTYSSNNPSVASVNSISGYVMGNSNGTATITARDQNGATASYTAQVSNVFNLRLNVGNLSFGEALNWMNSFRGKVITPAAFADMSRRYSFPFPLSRNYWFISASGGGCSTPYTSLYYNFIAREGLCDSIHTAIHSAWCLQDL